MRGSINLNIMSPMIIIFSIVSMFIVAWPISTQAEPVKNKIININYDNEYFINMKCQFPGLRIVKVNDLRDMAPEVVNMINTIDGLETVSLKESVSEFISKALTILIQSENTDTLTTIELDIEEFNIDRMRFLRDYRQDYVELISCIAVNLIKGDEGLLIGRIQTNERLSGVTDKKIEEVIYKSLVAFAQAIAERKVVLSPEIYDEHARPVAAECIPLICASFRDTAQPLPKMYPVIRSSVSVAYNSFIRSNMEGYGDSWNVRFGDYHLQDRRSRHYELGFLYGKGQPLEIESGWDVKSSDLMLLVFHFGGRDVYYDIDLSSEYTINPYFGAGLDVFLGTEKISLKAESGDELLDADFWSLRGSVGLHLSLGVKIKLLEKFSALIEARVTGCTHGFNRDIKFISRDDDRLYDVVQRSNFNFTGWSIHTGFLW